MRSTKSYVLIFFALAVSNTKSMNYLSIAMFYITKGASSMHGDVSSSLLEVLDPAQNFSFLDQLVLFLMCPFFLARL